MSFDLHALERAVAEHGRVARVVVAAVAGSSPREVGAAMLVWDGGQSGTIGGGALEHSATRRALSRTGLSRHPLGPELGQCCGGTVTLLCEHFDAARLAALGRTRIIARGPGDTPLAVRRLLDGARARGEAPAPQLVEGWMIEPLLTATRPLWIWGAGHVGRALVEVLHPLPELAITWVDTDRSRFPSDVPPAVCALPVPDPVRAVALAPAEAQHLILTYSHEIDLALCHALLTHGFAFVGLIGSDTKWARFRKRLRQLGHTDARIARICCPIGQKSLGKHPHTIAVGVAAQILDQNAPRALSSKEGATWQTHSLASGA